MSQTTGPGRFSGRRGCSALESDELIHAIRVSVTGFASTQTDPGVTLPWLAFIDISRHPPFPGRTAANPPPILPWGHPSRPHIPSRPPKDPMGASCARPRGSCWQPRRSRPQRAPRHPAPPCSSCAKGVAARRDHDPGPMTALIASWAPLPSPPSGTRVRACGDGRDAPPPAPVDRLGEQPDLHPGHVHFPRRLRIS